MVTVVGLPTDALRLTVPPISASRPRALRLVGDGAVALAALISSVEPLSAWEQVFADLARSDRLKIVFDPRLEADASSRKAACRALRGGGVPVVEITLTIPGALTPTEVARASQSGAEVIKLFPARVATPDYLRDLLGPLPATQFLPTGGIDEAGASAYLMAGALAVGIGSRLMPPAAVASGDVGEIGAAARRFTRVAAEARAVL